MEGELVWRGGVVSLVEGGRGVSLVSLSGALVKSSSSSWAVLTGAAKDSLAFSITSLSSADHTGTESRGHDDAGTWVLPGREVEGVGEKGKGGRGGAGVGGRPILE